jgi:DNA-binding NarL/FixJ family response regulator
VVDGVVTARDAGSIRLLVVARHPFRLEDMGLADFPDIETSRLIRRPKTLELAIDEVDPNVMLVDVGYPEGRGIQAIGAAHVMAPDAQILALTTDPPAYDDVVRAMRAGASGFIDTGAEPAEFAEALRTVLTEKQWLPPAETRTILSAGAEELEVTAAERRSRLTGIVIGLIPLAGILAGIMSLLFRKYLGHISVRPVDLGIDPTSRVVDLIFTVSLLLGALGPLLFVGTWLDLLGDSAADGKGRSWVVRRRTAARLLLSVGVLVVTGLLTVFADIVLLTFIGPVVAISLLAQALGLSDELPAPFRISVRPARAVAGGLIALFVFLTVLSTEVLVVGPRFDTAGAQGFIAPSVLGFSARPMLAFDVDGGRQPRQILYLGGNADLYILVDPCDGDVVEYVSVGSTRLVAIGEVACQ